MKKILVCGLSGSGKTTLVRELAPMLGAVVFNNDDVRRQVNKDLGFTNEDRLEHARRMGWLCDQVVKVGVYAIGEFICPTAKAREMFGECFTVFLNTVKSSNYPDTDALFEPPRSADVVFIQWADPKQMALVVRNALIPDVPRSMFVGRYQPPHAGHFALIQTAINEGKRPVIAIRDTPLSDSNPYSVAERRDAFLQKFGEAVVDIVVVPDITEICHGRDVGWKVREIRLSPELEAMSATAVRKGWDVGGTGI
jgi:cytidyltransferase-like protein